VRHIAVPTLAISAADDLFGTYDAARYSAAQVPGARFVGFADGGYLWVGHQDAVIGAIAAFVR
jgi:pimeloyl-ACP methyl ester carboxylesterase